MQGRLNQEQATNSFVQLPPLTLKPPYSDESRRNCLLLYRRGFNLKTIQRVTGVTNRKIIRQWLVEEDLLSLSVEAHQDKRQKCIDLYKQGYTPCEIEDLTRVHADLVPYWAIREGIVQDQPTYTEFQHQECLRLYFEKKLPRFQISKRTGVPDCQIKQWLEDADGPRKHIFKRGRPPLYSDRDKKKCLALFQKGYTAQQVEEMTEINAGTSLPWLKEHCLKLIEDGYPREEIENLTGVGYRVLKRWWCDTINSSA